MFGIAALLVATSGVYALLSFHGDARSREIGVRLALGATPARTVGMIVRHSLGWTTVGLTSSIDDIYRHEVDGDPDSWCETKRLLNF